MTSTTIPKITVNEILSPLHFCGDTVLTKRGDLFQVLRLKGIDPECMEPAQIESICQRFDAAIRGLDFNYRVGQTLFKTASPELPLPETNDSLAQNRAVWMEDRRPNLYDIKLYLDVLRLRDTTQTAKSNLLSFLSVRDTLRLSRQELNREIETLSLSVESLCVQLGGLLHPEPLNRHETLGFLRRLVNRVPWKSEVHGTVDDYYVDQQIVAGASDIDLWPKHLKQDEYFIRVLTLKDPPANTFPNIFRGLMSIPCEMILRSEWKREPNHVARAAIDSKRNIFHFGKASWRSTMFNKDAKPHEILIDESKSALVDILNAALIEMEVKENFFGRFSFTIALFHTDEYALRKATAMASEVITTHDGSVMEETGLALQKAWQAMVPGNYSSCKRPMWLLNRNYADLAMLYQPAEGNRVNEHLGKPALTVLETQEATPYWLNLHVGEVGHTFLLGATRSGKSFTANAIVSWYQQYQPYTLIFDVGHSYRRITEHYGGSYLHVSEPGAMTINPFCLEPNLGFLFSFVRVLIERNGPQMASDESKDLDEAIRLVYAMDAATRTLGTLARVCKRSYAHRLDEWVGSGRLARYFCNQHDTLTLSRFQAFDFEGVSPEIMEPLLFYVLHRCDQTIHDPALRAVPKLFLCDEAWRFFKHPVTREKIHEALKTWAKRNAAMVLATQSSDDMYRSEILATIVENTFTKIFLASPGMDQKVYQDTFKLNATQAEQISKLIPRQQMLVATPDGSKVLNLFVDPQSLRLFGV